MQTQPDKNGLKLYFQLALIHKLHKFYEDKKKYPVISSPEQIQKTQWNVEQYRPKPNKNLRLALISIGFFSAVITVTLLVTNLLNYSKAKESKDINHLNQMQPGQLTYCYHKENLTRCKN